MNICFVDYFEGSVLQDSLSSGFSNKKSMPITILLTDNQSLDAKVMQIDLTNANNPLK